MQFLPVLTLVVMRSKTQLTLANCAMLPACRLELIVTAIRTGAVRINHKKQGH